MEPRQLSSRWTFLNKVVLPLVVLAAIPAGALMQHWFVPSRDDVRPSPLLYISAIFVIGAWLYWGNMGLKYVRMDDRTLYISNGLREITVPLRDVTDVRYSRWARTHMVTVEFAHQTEFGESIVFMPPYRPFGFWSVHPVVAEIESAVAIATGRAPGQLGSRGG